MISELVTQVNSSLLATGSVFSTSIDTFALSVPPLPSVMVYGNPVGPV